MPGETENQLFPTGGALSRGATRKSNLLSALRKVRILFLLIEVISVGRASAQQHALLPYLTTNQSGYHSLPTVWTGSQRITLQTGYYKHDGDSAMKGPEVDSLRFDQYYTMTSSRISVARQLLSDSTATNVLQKARVYGYAVTLPTDSELSKARDIYSLTNALKLDFMPFIIYPTDANFAESQGFHFYTLGDHDTVHVMEVDVRRMSNETNVLGIVVKRGLLSPSKKP